MSTDDKTILKIKLLKIKDMKKVIFIFMLCLSSLIVHSQVISRSELEGYVQRGDKSWSATAKDISKKYQLNSNGELELCIIKEYPGKDKSQLYHQVLNWIISMSSNAQSAVQSCDENKGIILTRCYLPNIARRTMGDNSYRVSIRPLLRFDFKDGKIRFTYTLQNYEVLKTNDDSGYVILFGSFGVTGDGITQDSQIWNLKDCYPYNEMNWIHPKVTSSRALVNSEACFRILTDKLDNKLKEKATDDNW